MRNHSGRFRHIIISITCGFLSFGAKAQLFSEQLSPAGASEYAVANSSSGRLDLFTRGPSNQLYHWWGASNGSANSFENLGGSIASDPKAVSWGPGHIAVFYRGTDNALWYRQWDNGSDTGFQNLGGWNTYNPSVVALAPGHLIVFTRGSVTSQGIWYREFSAGVWGPWIQLGGWVTSSPVAVSWSSSHVAVFYRGNEGRIWYIQRNGGSWSSGATPGYTTGNDPYVVSRGPGLIDIIHTGSNGGGVWHLSYNNGTWGGSQLDSDKNPAAAVATSTGSLQVFGELYLGTTGTPICNWRFNNTIYVAGMGYYDSLSQQWSADGWFYTCLYGHNRALVRKVSNDGGLTWSSWEQLGPTHLEQPEVAPNIYGGWNLVAGDYHYSGY